MIDIFIGGLIVGASATYLACTIWHQRRRAKRPAGPPRVTAVHTDHPLQPEDLIAVRIVLTAYYQAQLDQAYRQVLDQVAADEAGAGVDAVEAAANERSAS